MTAPGSLAKPSQNSRDHPELLAAAVRWSSASVAWGLLSGSGSLAAGIAAESTALIGFGLSSLVDGTASSVLVWRFRHEQMATRPSHEVERRAARLVGTILVLVAIYVAARAGLALAHGSGPEISWVGLALASASMLVLPVLARAKLRLAGPVGSRALRADGVLSSAGAILAAAVLISLALDSAFGLWWADALAALAISAVLLREGILSIRSAPQL